MLRGRPPFADYQNLRATVLAMFRGRGGFTAHEVALAIGNSHASINDDEVAALLYYLTDHGDLRYLPDHDPPCWEVLNGVAVEAG